MRREQDAGIRFPGLYLVHHNLPGKKVSWHKWGRHTVFLPMEGDVRIELESGLIAAGPGRLIYVPPGTRMRFSSDESAGERLVCLIDDGTWENASEHQSKTGSYRAHSLCKEVLFYLLLNPTSSIASALVITFVKVLAESINTEHRPDLLNVELFESRVRDERVKKAIGILCRNSALPLRMAAVAKEAGVSQRNLSRLFVEELGLSPKQVLMHCRIAMARDLILAGHSVSEAARHCGYRSLPTFVSTFRRMAGQLPSEVARFGRKQEKAGVTPNVVSLLS